MEDSVFGFRHRISARVMAETRRLNELHNSGETPPAEPLSRIQLEELNRAFREYDVEVMPDTLLEDLLKVLERWRDYIRRRFPEGQRVMLAAIPCNINGSVHSGDDVELGEHIVTFWIDENTGLCRGYGALRPSTYWMMFPHEIQEQCSFIVRYSEGFTSAAESDFDEFCEQYGAAFKALKDLLIRQP